MGHNTEKNIAEKWEIFEQAYKWIDEHPDIIKNIISQKIDIFFDSVNDIGHKGTKGD